MKKKQKKPEQSQEIRTLKEKAVEGNLEEVPHRVFKSQKSSTDRPHIHCQQYNPTDSATLYLGMTLGSRNSFF